MKTKKLICVFITLLMVLSLIPTVVFASTTVASGECGAAVSWELDSDGVLTISGTGKMTDYKSESAVPWSDKRDNITSIIIKSGVTSIGAYAFYHCLGLTEMEIPEGITSIGRFAFQICSYLNCLKLPKSITSIGNMAFFGCTALNDIYYAGSSADWEKVSKGTGFVGFTMHFMEYAVTYNANGGDEPSKSYISVKPDTNADLSVTAERFGYILLGWNTDKDATVPLESYKVTGDVTLYTIWEHGGSCGANGDNVKWKLNKDGVLTIEGTGNMANYLRDEMVPWYEIRETITSAIIKKGVTSIGDHAFDRCINLKSIEIPEGVTSIGNHAFQTCSNLASIEIPESVTSIGNAAFATSRILASLKIPEGVTAIDDNTCASCRHLKSVELPIAITSIGQGAFDGCLDLTDVYYGGLEDDRVKILIEKGNDYLKNATWHYNPHKINDLAAIDEAVGHDTSDNVLAAAEEAKNNIKAAKTNEASGLARVHGIAAISAAKQDNIDANFQIIRGEESGLEGVPTVQSLKYEDGTARMRFIWQISYDTDISITSIGSYTFNWDSFDKGGKNAIVIKKNPEIKSGWTFDADLTDIPDFDESIRSIPMVNGIIFADSVITSTVNNSAIN